ncbi:DUF2946 family protein [Duganella sp. BuS-21]|uniref:DUF2946 family protein n=1 Tax=Duganella sp. BuS-21 TaxID=2943848 RepID=UPI0035A67601
MLTFTPRRRWTSMVVLMAILLNLCAPGLGQAASEPLAQDICRTGLPAPKQHPVHGFKHCVFCAAQAGDAAPPPTAAGLLAVLTGHAPHPFLLYATPSQSASWTDARPRGPPAPA